jgi:hypothetical protein
MMTTFALVVLVLGALAGGFGTGLMALGIWRLVWRGFGLR